MQREGNRNTVKFADTKSETYPKPELAKAISISLAERKSEQESAFIVSFLFFF
jgi:hypothetical protein